ncbi:MAG: phosphoribosylaminoimidazolesuccinocarboxamide synthase [Actinomycetota bacterium]
MSLIAELHARGKVRDIYEAGDDLLLVATDRVSVFDVVLPTDIPGKGQVLTGLSLFWFDKAKDLVANHVISANVDEFPAPFKGERELAGRATLVKRAEVVPVECVARGYITGSGWKEYQKEQSVCGVPLPAGLAESDKLPEPIFTPTTKAAEGHDMPLTFDEVVDMVGKGLAERLKELTLSIYEFGAVLALERGIILADTKFEFGFADGELILIDEVLTPDSSRFWPADQYEPGHGQPSYDKQFVRDWADSTGWDHEPPGPEVPIDVVQQTAAKYFEAYQRVTGEPFRHYLQRMGAE